MADLGTGDKGLLANAKAGGSHSPLQTIPVGSDPPAMAEGSEVPMATPVDPMYAGGGAAAAGAGAGVSTPAFGGMPPMLSDGDGGGPIKEEGYRDVLWLILFAMHFLCVFFMAFGMGVQALSEADAGDTGRISEGVAAESSIVGMLVVAALVGGLLSMAWVAFLQRNAQSIIKCTLYTSAAIQFVGACIAFAFSPGAGVLLLLFTAFTVCYIVAVRSRIPFASANLKIGTAAVRDNKSTVFVAFGFLLVQLLWVVIWGLAYFGVEANSEGDGNIAEVLMLVSLYWGTQVIQNIVHCTTAGAVGTWWFQPTGTVSNPVMGALKRACTTSLGSIALGSLIVAVLKTLRTLARNAQDQARRRGGGGGAMAAGCIGCILGCIENLIKYFNHYAYVYVALYGKTFAEAGKDVFHLFRDRGWTTIINDDLVDNALSIGCLMVGVVAGLIGAGWAYGTAGVSSSWIFASALVTGIIGFFMCAICSSVITSSVSTVFVCFAENPENLARTHPEHLHALLEAWRHFHPAVIEQCGYNARFPGAEAGAV